MKKRIALFILCVSLFLFSIRVVAQQSGTAQIISLKQRAQMVEFTIESAKPFYVGGNIHILHIGNKEFKISKQTKKDGKGILVFLIPLTDYNNLSDDNDTWLTYGVPFESKQEEQLPIKEICDQNPHNSWYLGKFSKDLLKN